MINRLEGRRRDECGYRSGQSGKSLPVYKLEIVLGWEG